MEKSEKHMLLRYFLTMNSNKFSKFMSSRVYLDFDKTTEKRNKL